MNNQPMSVELTKPMSMYLLCLQLVNLLTLILELSPWFIALAALCLIWQGAIIWGAINKPTRVIKLFIASVGCLLLLLTGKTLGLLLAMLHLLSFAYLLKPLELSTRKDFYQLVILGVLILTTSLIFQQSIYFAFLVLVLLSANLAWLCGYFYQQYSPVFQFARASKLLLQSIPLAIVLFVLFPKIPPFWQMPVANSATTGLSDNVAIGDISNLALSNELAFRVEFESSAPAYSQMYWRTLVLDTFDGTRWQQKTKVNRQNVSKLVKEKSTNLPFDDNMESTHYQVIAEPSYQHWLFALDVVKLRSVKQHKEVYSLKDFTLFSKETIAQPLSYSATSYLTAPLGLLDDEGDSEFDLLTQHTSVPLHSNPQLTAYAEDLKRQYQADHQNIVQAVLTRFSEQNYRYTLSPPLLTNNSIDEFFFSTKAGFCEHYASSFTYLMRAAGVPARLVLGYLGGEYNQQGNYYSIYQRDAHAWSEVWIQDKGWLRIDPTASVDPSRVERGFSDVLISEQQSYLSAFSLANLTNSAWLTSLRMQFDALDYQWTKLVISYSLEKQNQLLAEILGNDSHQKRALVIALAIVGAGLLIWLIHFLSREKIQLHIWQHYLNSADEVLKKLGYTKPFEQSSQQFLAKLAQENTSLARLYRQLLMSFEALHYQQLSTDKRQQLIIEMKQQLTTLKSYKRSKN